MLETIWKNIKYYTGVKKLRRIDVYRTERYGKGMTIETLQDIAINLDVPISLLVEDSEGFDMTKDLAMDIVCAEYQINKEELVKLIEINAAVGGDRR